MPGIKCWICGGPHPKKECPNRTVPQPHIPTPIICRHYRKHGHTTDQCYELHPHFRPGYPQGRDEGGRKGNVPRGGAARGQGAGRG